MSCDQHPDAEQGSPADLRDWPSTPYLDEMWSYRVHEPPLEESSVIGLFGDCTVAGTGGLASHQHLALRLRRAFPGQRFVVRNLAANGESADGFLSRAQDVFAELPRLDIAFIRYGINDRKQHGITACIDHLSTFCCKMEISYPGVCLIIETGIWVDYPKHYLWDRNARLRPLYQAMRAFADERGYPTVDIFSRMEEETQRGNWDLRIRGVGEDIYDTSFDAFFAHDPAYFTNIHPNGRCRGLIADWEVSRLTELFGETSPGELATSNFDKLEK